MIGDAPNIHVICQPIPRVDGGWIPNYSSADKYGKISYVFTSEDRPYAAPDASLVHARQVLKDFHAGRDFLLWSGGDPIALMIVTAALIANGVGAAQMLYWTKGKAPGGERLEQKHGYYHPIRVTLGDYARIQ